MTDSATVDLPEASSFDFAEPQQAGLTSTAHAAEADLLRSVPAAQPRLPQVQFLAPRPERDTSTAPADQDRPSPCGPGTRPPPGRPAANAGPDRHTDRSGGPCLRLVWSNTAYIDEATYLWAGHLEIAHLLHGDAGPALPELVLRRASHLSASSGGRGSWAASPGRAFSASIFMIGATALLWNITSRLFGYRAAFFAAALFAVLGPRSFSGRSPHTTPWRCSCWRRRHGASSPPGIVDDSTLLL